MLHSVVLSLQFLSLVFHDIDIFEEQSYFIKYSLVCLYLMFSHDYSQAVHFW